MLGGVHSGEDSTLSLNRDSLYRGGDCSCALNVRVTYTDDQLPLHWQSLFPECDRGPRPLELTTVMYTHTTHPMLSSFQLLERVLSKRGLQGGEPGGVAGGPGGCSQLAGCTSPCQSQQSRVTRA